MPVVGRFVRESYSQPDGVYAHLKQRGMNLVTITDHDSIDAVEPLRRYSDFFLSEEVTAVLPSSNEVHIGVYDITEKQHVQIQRCRTDFFALLAYLSERRIFASVNTCSRASPGAVMPQTSNGSRAASRHLKRATGSCCPP